MIKLKYIGEDDFTASLTHGEVLYGVPTEDGLGYLVKNRNGEEFYTSKYEAEAIANG